MMLCKPFGPQYVVLFVSQKIKTLKMLPILLLVAPFHTIKIHGGMIKG